MTTSYCKSTHTIPWKLCKICFRIPTLEKISCQSLIQQVRKLTVVCRSIIWLVEFIKLYYNNYLPLTLALLKIVWLQGLNLRSWPSVRRARSWAVWASESGNWANMDFQVPYAYGYRLRTFYWALWKFITPIKKTGPVQRSLSGSRKLSGR